jgi:putative ABC transport system permease protein
MEDSRRPVADRAGSLDGCVRDGACGLQVSAAARFFCLGHVALQSLFSFNLQSLLTLLTMAIGAFALAATLFAGEGALRLLWQDLDRLMGNRIDVLPDPGPNRNLLARRLSDDITHEDWQCVQNRLIGARYVAPRFFGQALVASGAAEHHLQVDGITEDIASEAAFQPIAGDGFSPDAYRGYLWECLLTQSAARQLALKSPVGDFIRIGLQRFRVVGLIEDPPESDLRFQSRVAIPFFEAQLLWGKPGVINSIAVAWDHAEKMESIIASLTQALDECRAPGAYYLSSSDYKIKKRKNIAMNFIAFGSTQALFCIVVASIGVVNVMLASVVRRMREFAVRIAMGARHRDIFFLVIGESALLGLVGGSIGVLVAASFAPSICRIISASIPEASQLVPYLGIKGVLTPLLVCGISGLLAGIIPAIRAGRSDILKVLRAE